MHKMENQTIGVNVRRFRLKCRMSEEQLALKVSKAYRRISTNSIKALEVGMYRPSPYRVYHIAKILGVNMEALLE